MSGLGARRLTLGSGGGGLRVAGVMLQVERWQCAEARARRRRRVSGRAAGRRGGGGGRRVVHEELRDRRPEVELRVRGERLRAQRLEVLGREQLLVGGRLVLRAVQLRVRVRLGTRQVRRVCIREFETETHICVRDEYCSDVCKEYRRR